MKKAYLTGATGCVGQNLLECLLDEGWDVTVLHRKSSDVSRLASYNINLKEVNFHSEDDLRRAVDYGADVFFHVAANLSHWRRDQDQQWKDNVLATRLLANVSREKKIKRFIFTSTGATNPYRHYDKVLSQSISIPYVRTKKLAELELDEQGSLGLDFVVLHPIIIIGRYDYNNYVEIFRQVISQKHPGVLPGRLSFSPAKDVAKAHLRAYENGRNATHYTLGGTHTTWLELSRVIAQQSGVTPPRGSSPPLFLHMAAYGAELASFFTGKTPLLSREVLQLLQDAPDIPYGEKYQASHDLGYNPCDLQTMVADCYEWLVQTGRLPASR